MTTSNQKIVPHLWFDTQAKEAAGFYGSVFPNSSIKHVTTMDNTPSGSVDLVSFELAGQAFSAISAGPVFKFNPSVSFLLPCETIAQAEALWKQLSAGGQELMPFTEYPFSERFGWTEDRYGVSWQVIYMSSRPIQQKIVPALMFVGQQAGKAEEAIRFYASIFPNSKLGEILRYGKGEEPNAEGMVKQAIFTLDGRTFSAMDSAYEHDFVFNEAISLMVNCDTQAEIDRYWEKLSAVPEAEQCGWLKDRYGLSWQIVPARMDVMMRGSDEAQMARVTEAFLAMKKFDLAQLEKAYAGR